LVPQDYQQEMAYGLSNGHVTNDVTWPQMCCEAVRSAILATAWLLVFYGINAPIKYRNFVPTTMGNFRFPASPPAVSGIESIQSVVTGCAVAQALCYRRHIIPMGASRDFLTFFRPTSGGQTPQPILTQNGSNDVHSRKDVPLAVKVATFHSP